MSENVYLGWIPMDGMKIPSPSRPPNDDVDPSNYIPKGMTASDRAALRRAGLEWTDSLGTAKGGFIGFFAGSRFNRAGQNISHFRHGDGKAVELSESEVADLQSQTALFSAVEREFVQLIAEDMRGRNLGTQRHFVAMNKSKTSPNAGTAWFGAYAKKGTGWYYAMGGFLLGYGAVALRGKTVISIWYRSFVYDRYNWDLGKETAVPTYGLRTVLNDSTMEEIAGLEGPDRRRYFRSVSAGKDEAGNAIVVDQDTKDRKGKIDGYEVGEQYVASDALLGALEESGDAKRYDINGAGRIVYVRVPI